MPALEIKNLTKKFDGFTAVDNISFSLAKNTVLGFLGPNGAGKTTTIRMIAGLSKSTSGEILINSQKVGFGSTKTNMLIGYLPEQPSLYTWMNGEEYLYFIANIFGIEKTKAQKLIKDKLALVGLKSAAKKKIGAYSNGMKQRLGIAQALVNDPELLIMDEPVSALDPIGRKEVLEIISELKKTKTILLSTHILSDVDRICDEVAIINKGKLIKVSPLTKLKEDYATPVLEIETDSDPEVIVNAFKEQKWVKNIDKNVNKLRIQLVDDTIMKENVPLKLLSQFDIGILKYGLVMPETEELFIDLIKGEKNE